MSCYFSLALGFICFMAGIVWQMDVLYVMSSVFICASVIISRCDTIITLLRMKQ